MIIRQATPKDNAALLELARQTPSHGIITMYSDQSPDFFKFLRMASDEYIVWVADSNGHLDGTAAEMYQNVQFFGKQVSLLTVGEMKASPNAKTAVGVSLLRHVAKNPANRLRDLGIAYILEGNSRAKRLYELFLSKKYVHRDLGNVVSSLIIPYRFYLVKSECRIRKAHLNDLPAIAEILQETYRSYDLSPEFSVEWLERELQKTDSLSIRDFDVAELNGRIVACAAFWDQTDIRKKIVLEFSPLLQLAMTLFRAFGTMLNFPELPRKGESLNFCYLRFPAARENHLSALKAIIHQRINSIRRERYFHVLIASFHQSDPLKDCIFRLPKISIKTHILIANLSGKVDLSANDSKEIRPIYTDLSLV
ncbi:MAG: hypothetical protein COT43_02040 [Candidatus Marinimicrobia bacterium CG08_land_8_20_14_0_20_45_22]|nr:MAG: hypothetical protein COT43_02040 [Candidatus Marinimicrobia bacterium CG08_land_8_20_14_0_20_45_22]